MFELSSHLLHFLHLPISFPASPLIITPSFNNTFTCQLIIFDDNEHQHPPHAHLFPFTQPLTMADSPPPPVSMADPLPLSLPSRLPSSCPPSPSLFQPRTAWSLLQDPPSSAPVLSTGCRFLDRLLDGGLRCGITEIVGEAGAAKSQLAFQLLLQVQLPIPPDITTNNATQPSSPSSPSSCSPSFDSSCYGLDGCGVYISTEGAASIDRLLQLRSGIYRRLPWTSSYDYLESIFVESCKSVEDLQSTIQRLPKRLTEHRIRLIIIDSIAGLFRLEEGQPHHQPSSSSSPLSSSSFSSTRADALFRISAELRRLSAVHQLIVVVCNQVTDRFSLSVDAVDHPSLFPSSVLRSTDHQTDRWAMESSGRWVIPALGLSWSSCINVRIGVKRSGGGRGGRGHGGTGQDGGAGAANGGAGQMRREMEVLFAPHLPQRQMQFEVDGEGVRGLEGTMVFTGEGQGGEGGEVGNNSSSTPQRQWTTPSKPPLPQPPSSFHGVGVKPLQPRQPLTTISPNLTIMR